MRLSGLFFAAFLLIPSVIWAQHTSSAASSGGGSSSSASSGGGSHGGGGGGGSTSSGGSSVGHSYGGGSSGGSHSYGGGGGRSGGGSASSGGGHSYGGAHSGSAGSASHSPSFRGTAVRSPNSIESARLSGRDAGSNLRYSPRGLNIAPQLRVAPPEKRTFFSFIRHPFHRPPQRPKPEIGIVPRPICFRGLCPVCPPGQVRAGGCSGGAVIPVQRNYSCSYQGLWNGSCTWQVQFADDCSGLRFALQRQLQRMQEAEAAMQGNCQAGTTQECSETTAGWNSESNLYRALQSRYRSCLAQSAFGYGFNGFMTFGLQSDLLVEPFGLGLYP